MKQWKWMLGVMAIATLSNCSDNELETIEDVNVIRQFGISNPSQNNLICSVFSMCTPCKACGLLSKKE